MHKHALNALLLFAPLSALALTTPSCIGAAAAQPAERDVITLKFANAKVVKSKLEAVYQGEGVVVESDERTNSLIVVAATSTLAEIQRLVAKLDIEVK